MSRTRRNYVVIGLGLLEHQEHCLNIIGRVSPIALGVEITHLELFCSSQLDSRHRVCDFASDELQSAPLALMVEKDSRTGEQVITLAVVDRDVMTIHFGNAIGTPRVKRGHFT